MEKFNIVCVADVPMPDETPEFLRFKETLRVGIVGYDSELGYIDFYNLPLNPEYANYNIEISRLNSPAKQMDWIWHLYHKRWFTPQVMHDFLTVLYYVGMLEAQEAKV